MRRISLRTVLITALVLTALWLGWIPAGTWFVEWSGRKFADAGQFGDSFGAVTSLFSMLGLLGILITIWLQQDDQHLQRFESSFFEMLQLLRDVRDEVTYTLSPEYRKEFAWEPEEQQRGLEAFAANTREFLWLYNLEIHKSEWDGNVRLTIADAYDLSIDDQRGFSAEPYFRLLYTLLKRIDTDSVLTINQKLDYGRLLRSQLTANELAMTAVSALHFKARDLPEYLTRFRLLKYLPRKSDIRGLIENQYHASAFASTSDLPLYNRNLNRRGKLGAGSDDSGVMSLILGILLACLISVAVLTICPPPTVVF